MPSANPKLENLYSLNLPSKWYYTSNALNQYTQRGVPGVFDVAGAAGSGTMVTVNGSSSGVTRHGEYFFKGQSMANNPNPVFSTLAVSDGTTTTNLAAFVAGTPEAFSYDDDGNLLSDGRWDYVWDAENRLVSVTTHTALFPSPIPAADARRLEFKYDYRNRRVQKTVLKRNTGNTAWVTDTDTKFLYDGWNAIARLNALSLALIASHYWGIDFAGPGQRAGGVGGLALTVEGGNTYLPIYDGNGNVMGLIKASNGSVDAAHEYDAFGNTLRESGSYAASNPFRFATKYADVETGLVQYHTRYYSPSLGRFINRDTIGEQGGLNLYAYCSNNGVNKWDYLGMDPVGQPGFAEGLVPIWGSGRAAVDDFQNGRYVWGTVNSVLAISDVLLIKSAFTAGGKLLWKAGSNTWSATSKWLTKEGIREFPGQNMHHWLIPQNGWGQAIPDVIKNQPFNLLPLEPPAGVTQQLWHNAIEGKGAINLSPWERLWFGSPTYAKFGAANVLGKVINGERGLTTDYNSSLFFNNLSGVTSAHNQARSSESTVSNEEVLVLEKMVVHGNRSAEPTYTVTPGPSFAQQWDDLQRTLGHRPSHDEWWNREFKGGAPGSLRDKIDQMMRSKTPEEMLEEEIQKRKDMQAH